MTECLADIRKDYKCSDQRLMMDFLRFNPTYFTPELFEFMSKVPRHPLKKYEWFIMPSLLASPDGVRLISTLMTEMKSVGQLDSLKHLVMIRCHFSLFIALLLHLEPGLLSKNENFLIDFERTERSSYGEDLKVIELKTRFEDIFINHPVYVDDVIMKLFVIARNLHYDANGVFIKA
jgi:hypothetical protein